MPSRLAKRIVEYMDGWDAMPDGVPSDKAAILIDNVLSEFSNERLIEFREQPKAEPSDELKVFVAGINSRMPKSECGCEIEVTVTGAVGRNHGIGCKLRQQPKAEPCKLCNGRGTVWFQGTMPVLCPHVMSWGDRIAKLEKA